MQPFTFLQPCELQKPLTVTQLSGVVFTADVLAATFMVDVLEGGEAVSLTGATVTGYAIRADGATVTLAGSASGNRASITLDASCYVVQGPLDIVIKVTSGGATVTVGAWRAYVQRSTTDAIVDPGHVIPSLEELLEKIDEMEDGTEAANAAAAKLQNMTADANGQPSGNQPTVAVSEVSGHYNLSFGLVPSSISSQATQFQNSASGTTVPSGTWLDTQPVTPQGQFLWMRHTITWNSGATTVLYSVSHQGLDGAGSVSSVNGISPDSGGNVTLPVDSAPAQGSANPVSSGGVYTAVEGVNTAVEGVKAAVAIVANGDTATQTIPAGKFVLWHGALYTASASIPSGDPLSSSNLTAVPDGGLNSVLPLSGGTMTGDLILANNGDYPRLDFDSGNGPHGAISNRQTGSDASRFSFFEYADANDAGEVYLLPASNGGHSSNVYYEIATGKNIGSFFGTGIVNWTYSAAVGSNANANLKTLIDNELPAGKTFLAISGFQSGYGSAVIYSAAYVNSNYSFGIHNYGPNEISNATASIRFLYV